MVSVWVQQTTPANQREAGQEDDVQNYLATATLLVGCHLCTPLMLHSDATVAQLVLQRVGHHAVRERHWLQSNALAAVPNL